jgi:hypothetical protein
VAARKARNAQLDQLCAIHYAQFEDVPIRAALSKSAEVHTFSSTAGAALLQHLDSLVSSKAHLWGLSYFCQRTI